MENSFVLAIIVLVVAFVLFLILRELNCWYWKINQRISLMEEQNLLLKKIFSNLVPSSSNEIDSNPASNNVDTIESNKINLNNLVNDVFDNLSEKEKQKVDEFIKYGIYKGHILAIHRISRDIHRFNPNEWEKLIKEGENVVWEIILK